MDVIHFTSGAADPLKSFSTSRASFLPLADGEGDTHISCLHLSMGAKVSSPSLTHACLLLCVHGSITVITQIPRTRIDLHAGMGAVAEKNEPYSLKSEEGAILLIVESQELAADVRALSTSQRIAGATWPTDSVIRE
jgi:hypothetical protein